MQRHLRNKAHIFKQILINEDLFSSSRLKNTAVDIENSFIGREMNTLLETISGVQTIYPYCDVSLRVIMRMADILQARNFCYFSGVNMGGTEISNYLCDFYRDIYRRKKL